MANQIWRPVVGYEGRYEVSNMGNVRSYVGSGRVNLELPPRMLRPKHDKTRTYPSVNLSHEDQTRKLKCVHILVAQAFIPNPDGKPWVNHKDGNKLNSKRNNLEWTTPKENQKHAYDTGLKQRPLGTKNVMNVLSEEQVMEIFNLERNSYELATMYGVTRTCIQGIKNGRIWGHLTGMEYKKRGIRKFTKDEVLEIYSCQETQAAISRRYGVAQGVISSIKTGRTHSKTTGAIYNGRKSYTYYGIEVFVGGRTQDISSAAKQ